MKLEVYNRNDKMIIYDIYVILFKKVLFIWICIDNNYICNF